MNLRFQGAMILPDTRVLQVIYPLFIMKFLVNGSAVFTDFSGLQPDHTALHRHGADITISYANCIFTHIDMRVFFRTWCIPLLVVEYGTTFQRLDERSVPSQIQIATPSTSTAAGTTSDNSSCETYNLVPRPTPYDADPRYSGSQREGLVSRREKSMGHIKAVKKRNIAESEGYKLTHTESEKNLSTKACDAGFVITTSEDEDVCPTCLEVVYMNGWKEVTSVPSVEREWNFVRAHDDSAARHAILDECVCIAYATTVRSRCQQNERSVSTDHVFIIK
ncbi:E3 ubiquitin-protein ligase [Canna indica]|uniref:E3 ubiquitin-protein ligase n=1 Tax=Canna indica TaxID=4628 RepID=A0AAQ3Q3P6_9LILI|nr:E3 ubiquitin-protein ligase [Canna indica]